MIHLVHCYEEDVKRYSPGISTDTTIDQALNELKKHDELALDTETTSLKFSRANVLMLQLGTKSGDQYVFDMRTMPIEGIKSLLEDSSITYIGHNIKFDYNVLKTKKILL